MNDIRALKPGRETGAGTIDTDREIFRTGLVFAGEIRCPPDHPDFAEPVAACRYAFGFPLRACWLAPEHGRPFVADSTVVPLFNPGRAFRRRSIGGEGEIADWFGIDEPILRQGLASLGVDMTGGSAPLLPRPFVAGSAGLYLAQRCVFNHLRSTDTPDPLYVEETIIAALAEILEQAWMPPPETSITPAHRRLVDAAREHLNQRLLEREHLSEIAAALDVSTFHLCRIFRRETGTSLHRYRLELRLRRSLEWLDDSDDITAVALEAGFAQHSHYTAAFRRSFGISPSEFRTLWRSRRVSRR